MFFVDVKLSQLVYMLYLNPFFLLGWNFVANEPVPNGVRVRVINLPKKKNVHRDLSTAFEGVPGLISINPAVLGKKKTRDPICKGFAFVDFKSEEHATRYIKL